MAIDFPNNPSLNDTFESGGRTWKWDGTSWTLIYIATTAHAATHSANGTDPVSISTSQIIDLNPIIDGGEPADIAGEVYDGGEL